jgi:GT2 family glycosyltransferase
VSAPTVATEETLPGLVRDVELAEPLAGIDAQDSAGRRVEQAWLLVRIFTEPLGLLRLTVPDEGLSAADVAAAIGREYGGLVDARIRAAGGDPVGSLPLGGVRVPTEAPFLAQRRRVLADAPPITIVVCTRERPDALAVCLASLQELEYPHARILVVDNAPTSDATEQVVRSATGRFKVDYLLAPRPGLSHARNAAVAATAGEILAWVDDDEIADRYWLAEVARALAEHPEADVVSGVIVPAELETRAQAWFEQFGGHSKGRGFTPAVFSPATARQQSPLYPLPPFGTGANMVFRAGVIERIGGFDTALGAGTPAMGGEDTLAFTQVLRRGGSIVYQPSAIMRHFHRRDLEGLRRQMVGYGTGLTAYYVSLLRRQPWLIFALLRLVPTAARDVLGGGGLRTATIEDDFPADVLGGNKRGMLAGPWAYRAGRRNDRRARRAAKRATTR